MKRTDTIHNLLYHSRSWANRASQAIVVFPGNLDIEQIKTEYATHLNHRLILTHIESLKNSTEFSVDFTQVRPNGIGIRMTTATNMDNPKAEIVVLFHDGVDF